MYSEKKHIIEKVILDINESGEQQAQQIKNYIGDYAQNKLFPVIQELLNEYDTEENIIRLDRLDINFSLQDWEDDETMKFKLSEKLRAQLIQATKTASKTHAEQNGTGQPGSESQIVKTKDNIQNTFLFFIEKGYLPWFGKPEYIDEITSASKWNKSIADQKFVAELKRLFRKNDTATERFTLQVSEELILKFIGVSGVLKIKNEKKLLHFVNSCDTGFRKNFLMALILLSVNATRGYEFLRKMLLFQIKEHKITDANLEGIVTHLKILINEINRHFEEEPISEFLPTEDEIREFVEKEKGSKESVNLSRKIEPTILNLSDKKEFQFFDKDKTEIFVRNAGLVILGPFLPTFLKQFNWTSKSGKIKKDAKVKAVQAFYFLATGEIHFFEANMVFEKFLCGLPLSTPIPQKSLLNNEVKEEAEDLLRQVIKYWPALKNTGAGGLRQMFLNRNGKLIKTENGFKLLIERKTQDILLDKLQWNISLLKLPWKEELLFVEW